VTIASDPVSAQRALRDVLGRFATGVTVVTTTHRDRAVGLTVNSLTSVSLRPPLVLWCLNRASSNRMAFTVADHFAVNVLAADQHALATRFASPGDRFARLAVEHGPHGLPLLSGTVATLVCRRDRIVPAGDHIVFVGEVIDQRATAGAPLLFVDGQYHAGP
jgi:flavin reductase (DIM6/NTAB) family NADH-FMN oxidoreductase RutF